MNCFEKLLDAAKKILKKIITKIDLLFFYSSNENLKNTF